MSVEENTKFVDYYGLLGVSPDAGMQQIRSGYLRMAKTHHPDAGGTNEMMRGLNTAYKTLVQSSSRAAYDMLHSFHTGMSAGKYREEHIEGLSAKNMSDEYVDFFIDSVFAEYHAIPKQKTTFTNKIKSFFTA